MPNIGRDIWEASPDINKISGYLHTNLDIIFSHHKKSCAYWTQYGWPRNTKNHFEFNRYTQNIACSFLWNSKCRFKESMVS